MSASSDPGVVDPPVDRWVIGFVHALRTRGVDVAVDSTITFAQALDAVGVGSRSAVYWAGRATLTHCPEDEQAFVEAFDAFWLGDEGSVSLQPPPPVAATLSLDDGLAADDSGEEKHGPTVAVRYTSREALHRKDFASCTRAELDEAHRLMDDLRLTSPLRRSRRQRRSRRSRGRLDVRRTVRHALRAGGEPIRRAHLEPAERRRRLVLLCDVSGSMEPYARELLRFTHATVAGRPRVEAFTLGTRLTRVTRELAGRDPDRALSEAADAVADWSGGTRLGEGLRRFCDQWGVRGLARGATVVILSDGWDRGDTDLLAEQMARLARVAHRIVWVNPLKASPGYAPLAQGMAAALPYVDQFVEGHSVSSLERLAEVIAE